MCKYLVGDGKKGKFKCSALHRECPYQRYCPTQNKFVAKPDNCPKYKKDGK